MDMLLRQDLVEGDTLIDEHHGNVFADRVENPPIGPDQAAIKEFDNWLLSLILQPTLFDRLIQLPNESVIGKMHGLLGFGTTEDREEILVEVDSSTRSAVVQHKTAS